MGKVFVPCYEHCYIRFGKQYSKECDSSCDYARVILENKKLKSSRSDLTFTMKLESARYNPSAVPAEKWSEYFAEVFDQLRDYETVEAKD